MTTTNDDGGEQVEEVSEERILEEKLRVRGIAIVSEKPEHKSGSMTFYRIEAHRPGLPEDRFTGQGATRTDALKAVLVSARA